MLVNSQHGYKLFFGAVDTQSAIYNFNVHGLMF